MSDAAIGFVVCVSALVILLIFGKDNFDTWVIEFACLYGANCAFINMKGKDDV